MTKVPNPGSDEAVRLWCACPIWDNHRGMGFRGEPGVFAINGDCPLHGLKAVRGQKEQEGDSKEGQ